MGCSNVGYRKKYPRGRRLLYLAAPIGWRRLFYLGQSSLNQSLHCLSLLL